jgi:glutathione S-transferase
MEPMFLPWILNNRKRHGSMGLPEIQIIKKPRLSKKPQFRFISFCQRDLAEMCRLIFVYAKVPFENITIHDIEFDKITAEVGPKMNGPMLEWNGKMIHGTDAIARMLAKMYGLAGAGIYEQAQADTIIGIVSNLSNSVIEYTKGTFGFENFDEEKCYNETFEPAVKKYFAMLEKYASQGPDDGFFFSSGVTYADFAVANIFELVASMHPELLIKYKNVNAITQRVFAIPQLQKYLSSLPSMKEIMDKNLKLAIKRKWCSPNQKELTIYKSNKINCYTVCKKKSTVTKEIH